MAFGKKKNKEMKNQKKSREIAVKQKMVEMSQNPLYPEKQENTAKDILTAVGTAAVCLVLVAVITMKFSYSAGNVQAYQDEPSYEEGFYEEQTPESVEETENLTEMEEQTQEVETEVVEEELMSEDYIIADSNSRYINASELEGMSKEELSYARNEIYARHGRKFKDEGLQTYFDSKEWYEGTIAPDDFYESMLNDYEIKNAETILLYEKEKGYR